MSFRHVRPAVERLVRLALDLGAGRTVTLAYIMAEHGVCLATAKRDMIFLERMLPVVNEPIERERGGIPSRSLRIMPGAKIAPLLCAAAA